VASTATLGIQTPGASKTAGGVVTGGAARRGEGSRGWSFFSARPNISRVGWQQPVMSWLATAGDELAGNSR